MAMIGDLATFIDQMTGAAFAAPVVFWDGYALDRPYAGIFQHAKGLAGALPELGVRPVVVGAAAAGALLGGLDTAVLPAFPGGQRLGGLKFIWPQRVERLLAAVPRLGTLPHIVHGLSNFNIPSRRLGKSCRLVLTVHDLIPLLAPEAVSAAYYWQFRVLVAAAIRRADAVVCVSEWTRQTLLERFPGEAKKMVTIPNGVGESAVTQPRPPGGAGYCLMVSRGESYKRLPLFFDIVRRSQRPAVLVTDERGAALCRMKAADLVTAGRLRLATAMPPEELSALYRQSAVYVQTSQYEGFCLPAAEALARGIPVVYQAGTGTDEVVGAHGGIALPVNAPASAWHDAVEAAAAFGQQDFWRSRLAESLAKLTTWKDAAAALKKLYNDVM